VFAQFFDDTVAGNLNGKRVILESIKAAGMRLSNFIVTPDQAKKNAMEKMRAQGAPVMEGQGGEPIATGQLPVPEGETPMIETEAGNIPSAEELPPTPTAEPPGPSPMTI